MRLKVIKADGSVEDYFHTKVIGAINNALSAVDRADVDIAEHLADVVTYFLHHRQRPRVVSSGEIFSIIKAALTVTGYEEAAAALNEHRFERRLKRCRVEVICVDIQELADAELLVEADSAHSRFRWDKSRIVNSLVNGHNVDRQTARMIASMVEEKVLGMGITVVSASLIRQLVLGDAAAVLRVERQLQTV